MPVKFTFPVLHMPHIQTDGLLYWLPAKYLDMISFHNWKFSYQVSERPFFVPLHKTRLQRYFHLLTNWLSIWKTMLTRTLLTFWESFELLIWIKIILHIHPITRQWFWAGRCYYCASFIWSVYGNLQFLPFLHHPGLSFLISSDFF